MNVGAMRSVDRFLGIPLCLATGIWSRMFRRQQPSAPERWRSVLVIKFFGMGSVLLSSSFLTALQQGLPQVRIIYLTFDTNKQILERLHHPAIRLTIATSSILVFVRDTWEIWRTIRRESVDAVFDLEFFSKFSTLLSFLSGAPLRVGYALPTRWRRMHLTHPVPFTHNRHVTGVFLSQLDVVGLTPTPSPAVIRLEASPAEKASMEHVLNLHSNGFEIIAVNINAGSTSLERRWPARRFVEVCRSLLAKGTPMRFVFTGAIEERDYVESALVTDTEVRASAVNAAGLLSIGELVALLERSSLLLTNDSGPMHIASAVGTRVVALFGPESPGFYGPSSESSRLMYKAIECSPCLNAYNAKLFICPFDARCMKEISVSEVLAAIHSLRPAIAT